MSSRVAVMVEKATDSCMQWPFVHCINLFTIFNICLIAVLSSLESLFLHEMVKAMLLSMFYAAVCVSNHKSAEGREEL